MIRIVPAYRLADNLIEKATSLMKPMKEVNILDLGCGRKPFEKKIKKLLEKKSKKINYVGVDYYSEEADLKIDLNKNKLPFKDKTVDLIVITEVLEHLYNPLNALKEMKRVIKNGGFLIITVPFLFPIHEKKHDYFRYSTHFFKNYFKKEQFKEVVISNTAFSFPLYLISYYISIIFPSKYKVVGMIQKPFDWAGLKLFKKRVITYSYYMDSGYLIKIKNNKK